MEGHTLHRRNFLLHLQDRPGYDGPVLLKESAHQPPTHAHLDQLHYEYAITTQLADVPGVRPAYAKEGTESQPVLLLVGGRLCRGGQTKTSLVHETRRPAAERRVTCYLAKCPLRLIKPGFMNIWRKR